VLKDRHGAVVTVLALDEGDVDQTLFTALAKGADEAWKITPLPGVPLTRRQAAAVFAQVLRSHPADLILTGVQAISDLDGHLPGLLGGLLDLPYVGVTRSVEAGEAETVTVHKEYPGGTAAEIELRLPAVVGVLSAPQPPRYVPVARIREMTKTKTLAAVPPPEVIPPGMAAVRRMFKPELGTHAQMLEGAPDAVAAEMIGILEGRGVLR
jgi:electron transfer flavoprotein beta subunit